MALWNTAYEKASANRTSPKPSPQSSVISQEDLLVSEIPLSARINNITTSRFVDTSRQNNIRDVQAENNFETSGSPHRNRVLQSIDRQVVSSLSPASKLDSIAAIPFPRPDQDGREARWAMKNSFEAWRSCSTTRPEKQVIVIEDPEGMRELERLVTEKDRALSSQERQLRDLRDVFEAEQLRHSEILQAIGSIKFDSKPILSAISIAQAEEKRRHSATNETQMEVLEAIQALKHDIRHCSREQPRQNPADLESIIRSVFREVLPGLRADLLNAGEDLAQKARVELARKMQEMEQSISSALVRMDTDLQKELSVACSGLGHLRHDVGKTAETLKSLKEEMLSDSVLRSVLRQSLSELRTELGDDEEALANSSRAEIMRKIRELEQSMSSTLAKFDANLRDVVSTGLSEQLSTTHSEFNDLKEDFRKTNQLLGCLKDDALTENVVRSVFRELHTELQTQLYNAEEGLANKSRTEIVRSNQETERNLLSAFAKLGGEVQADLSAALSEAVAAREVSREIEQSFVRLRDEVTSRNRTLTQSIADLAKVDRNSEILEAMSRIRVNPDLSPILAAIQTTINKIDASPQLASINSMINALQSQTLQAISASSAGVAQTIAKIKIPDPDFSPILVAVHTAINKMQFNPRQDLVAPINVMMNNLQSQVLQAINVSSTRLVQSISNMKIDVRNPTPIKEVIVAQQPPNVFVSPPATEIVTTQPQSILHSPRAPDVVLSHQPQSIAFSPLATEIVTSQPQSINCTPQATEVVLPPQPPEALAPAFVPRPQVAALQEVPVSRQTSFPQQVSQYGDVVQELFAQPPQLAQVVVSSEQDLNKSRSSSMGKRFSFTTGPRVREGEMTPRRLENSQQAIAYTLSDVGNLRTLTSVPSTSRSVFMGQASSRDTSPMKDNFRPPRLMRAISAATSSLMTSPVVSPDTTADT